MPIQYQVLVDIQYKSSSATVKLESKSNTISMQSCKCFLPHAAHPSSSLIFSPCSLGPGAAGTPGAAGGIGAGAGASAGAGAGLDC